MDISCRFQSDVLSLIGFEDLGNSDGFETAALELRLQMCGECVFVGYYYLKSTYVKMIKKTQVSLTNRASLSPCERCIAAIARDSDETAMRIPIPTRDRRWLRPRSCMTSSCQLRLSMDLYI